MSLYLVCLVSCYSGSPKYLTDGCRPARTPLEALFRGKGITLLVSDDSPPDWEGARALSLEPHLLALAERAAKLYKRITGRPYDWREELRWLEEVFYGENCLTCEHAHELAVRAIAFNMVDYVARAAAERKEAILEVKQERLPDYWDRYMYYLELREAAADKTEAAVRRALWKVVREGLGAIRPGTNH